MNIHNKIIITISAFRRLITAGNAGGVIVSLSLIGSMWGTSNGQPTVPFAVFCALIIFFIGLFICGYALWAEVTASIAASELELARGPARESTTDDERDEARESCEKNTKLIFRLSLYAAAFFAFGTGIGLWQLYSVAVVKSIF